MEKVIRVVFRNNKVSTFYREADTVTVLASGWLELRTEDKIKLYPSDTVEYVEIDQSTEGKTSE